MNQLAVAAPELVPTLQVFTLEQGQGFILPYLLDMGVLLAKRKGNAKFFYIDLPVTAQLYQPTQSE